MVSRKAGLPHGPGIANRDRGIMIADGPRHRRCVGSRHAGATGNPPSRLSTDSFHFQASVSLLLRLDQPICPRNRWLALRQPAWSGYLTLKVLMSAWVAYFTRKILNVASAS